MHSTFAVAVAAVAMTTTLAPSAASAYIPRPHYPTTPQPSSPTKHSDPTVTVEPIAKGALRPDRRYAITARITIPPHRFIDWHTHPGRTTGVVTEGTLTIVNRRCYRRQFATGRAFHPPRKPHTARNFGDETVTIVATFLVRGETPTIMVGPRTARRLDRRCGFDE